MQSEGLARRAVACKGWRWMPGMRIRDGRVIRALTDADGNSAPFALVFGGEASMDVYGRVSGSCRHVPDLDDPATLGCLLALVREAWGDPCFVTDVDAGPGKSALWYGVSRYTPGGGWATRFVTKGATEAEALVAALEAAP